MAKTLRWTYSDFLTWPDDGYRYEILDGEMVKEPAPLEPHQATLRRLVFMLGDYLGDEERERLYFAPFAVILDDHNVVQPDLLYVRASRHAIVQEKGVFGPPDFVVEILSPSTKKRDLVTKRDIYARLGIVEYWVIDTKQKWIDQWWEPSAEGYQKEKRHAHTDAASSVAIEGFTLRVSELFPSY